MNIHHHDETTKVIHGDCIETMNAMSPESVDAIVTDPPYGLGFMGKKWDGLPPSLEWAEACYRVLKPGGHIAAFGGTRTWHRLAVAIEDAGFEMRDSLAWLYGSGFPKSHDVGKAIDKLAGAEREVIGRTATPFKVDAAAHRGASLQGSVNGDFSKQADEDGYRYTEHTAPATPEAEQWDGWGTALKPAFEPIVLARKPLAEKTVARNVLEHGTGAINIDACRIATDDNLNGGSGHGILRLGGCHTLDELKVLAAAGEKTPNGETATLVLARAETAKERMGEYVQPSGRWPANVLLDQHTAAWVDEQSGVTTSPPVGSRTMTKPRKSGSMAGALNNPAEGMANGHGDSGGASRFFYTAKAPKRERPNVDGVQHPTVKPLAIMRWLIRLVTPPGGVLLDPFAGSGTTLEAARNTGHKSIGIEAEESYLPLIDQRLQRSNTGPTED